MRSAFLGVSAAVIGIGLAAAGCSSGSGGTSAAIGGANHKAVTGTKPGTSMKPGSSLSPMAASPAPSIAGTVGDDCAKLPASGTGSVDSMAKVPIATAISHNPQLTELAHAINAAGLTSMLNSVGAITFFAPDNSAFNALGSGNLKTLMLNKADLGKLLEYHAVKGEVSPAELAAAKPVTTLAGLPVHPVKSGNDYKINGAQVTCGNIRTTNGKLYIVDKVLIPTP
jgi:uncharacterized surface protein with fasciclin (FAS1) repeats